MRHFLELDGFNWLFISLYRCYNAVCYLNILCEFFLYFDLKANLKQKLQLKSMLFIMYPLIVVTTGSSFRCFSTCFFVLLLVFFYYTFFIVMLKFRLKSYIKIIYISDYRVYVMGSFKRLVNFLNKYKKSHLN